MFEIRLDLGRTTLNVARSANDGSPLVLWHGLARRWQDFANLLPALCSRYKITAVDHRGHGKSARMPGEYLVEDYVADGIALLDSEVREPAILYGHSLGALTALGVAAARPESVLAVVLEDPPSASLLANIEGTNYGLTWRTMRERAGKPDLNATVDALARIRLIDGRTLGDVRDAAALRFLGRCLVDLDPQTLTPALEGRWLNRFDLLAIARRVACPVLLLASDPAVGGLLPSEDATDLASALPDCSRVDFPGRGHLLHGEQPEAVLKVVLPFLESLR